MIELAHVSKREVLEVVGLEHYEKRYPGELSGGQQQRVALARAVAPEPSVVLLDEPWSNIDPVLRASMRDGLAAVLRSLGVTVVLVTHDREEALSLADRIALMRAGSVVQAGRPEALYHAPATRWAAEFVGATNFLPGRIVGDLVETSLGRFPVANRNDKTAVEEATAGLGRSGAALVVLSTMKELPATLLLRPIGFETLATEIWRFTSIGAYSRAALPALLLVAAAAPAVYFLVRRGAREAHRS